MEEDKESDDDDDVQLGPRELEERGRVATNTQRLKDLIKAGVEKMYVQTNNDLLEKSSIDMEYVERSSHSSIEKEVEFDVDEAKRIKRHNVKHDFDSTVT